MILHDRILRSIGPSIVAPFDETCVQPASIDLHIDRFFIKSRVNHMNSVDPELNNDPHFDTMFEVPRDHAYNLEPGAFVLASTYERVRIPEDLVARFEGKSSLARLGLLTHITAGFIDPGFNGHITLELKNVIGTNWRIWPGMKIGQIAFEQLVGRAGRPYGAPQNQSHYQNAQRGPTLSRSHERFQVTDVYKDQKKEGTDG